MKQFLTLLLLAFSLTAFAQIPLGSPYPGEFRIESPSSLAGTYDVGKQSGWGDTLTNTVCGPMVWAYDFVGVYSTDTTLVDSSYYTYTTTTETITVDSFDYVYDDMGMIIDSVDVSYSYDVTTTDSTLETVQNEVITQVLDSFTSDSLLCDPVAMDLTGKVAAARRGGDCAFSLKTYNAQMAGAVGVVIFNHYNNATENATFSINMSATASPQVSATTIPAVFMSRFQSEQFKPLLDAGEAIEACFYVPSFFEENGPFAYATPQSEVSAFNLTSAKYVNFTPDAITVDLTVEITPPSGPVSTVTQSFICPPDSVFLMEVDDEFLPSATGTYNMKFTNDQSTDELTREFIVTDSLYSVDDLVIDDFTAVDSASFAAAGLKFDVGSTYFTSLSPTERVATHAHFALNNIKLFHEAAFDIVLWDMDPDGDGQLATTLSYDAFSPVGFANYVVDSNTVEGQQLITVELDDPVLLKDTGAYFLSIRFDGVATPTSAFVVPQYSAAGNQNFRTLNTMIFAASTAGTPTFFSGGWTTNEHNVARLTIAPFSGTDDQSALASSQVKVFPNPTSDELNLELTLNEMSPTVKVEISDAAGRLVATHAFENIQQGVVTVPVKSLSAGTYFATVYTSEGFRTKLFQVIR